MLVTVAAYLVHPHPSNPLSAALFLSYPLDPNDPFIAESVRLDPNAPTHYGKGARDFAFVAFYIIVLSFTREFCMQRLIRPIAVRLGISRNTCRGYVGALFGKLDAHSQLEAVAVAKRKGLLRESS